MQLAMEEVNTKLKQQDWPGLEMGIGINTGNVVVGNMGSEKRCKFSVIGNNVNLAYRIESNTTGGQIFISASTFKEVESIVQIHTRRDFRMKGIQETVTIYDVKGIGGDHALFLPDEDEVFWPLAVEIPLQYQAIEEKRVDALVFKGSIVKLSARGAEIRADQNARKYDLSGLCDLQLNLINPDDGSHENSGFIYAKVLDIPAEEGRFYIHFTALSPQAGARLDTLYAALST